MPHTIIVSDLDGTLLDPATYLFKGTGPALGLIRERGIPLVLCSSKTRAEIEIYRQYLDNRHPFISENGGGIFIPQGYFSVPIEAQALDGYSLIALGMPYADIRDQFVRLRERLSARVRGFADMSSEEVAALTGLSLAEAALAKQRDFDEPFIFEGTPDERFLRAIESSNLRWTQGRLFHIMGNHDKGRAVRILRALYERQYGAVTCIGLGDSLNDLPMLEAVDRPVLVQHADGSFDQRINLPGLLKTQQPGPLGWNGIMLQLLADAPVQETSSRPHAATPYLTGIFDAALAAADPCRAMLNAVRLEDGNLLVSGAAYKLSTYQRIMVVGAGKATARMAQVIEELLGERISAGLVIVKHGHTAPLHHIEQVEAAHPIPDEAGAAATRRMLEMVRAADDRTLVICLFSGGASALLVAPVKGLTLQDKQQATGLLLNAGASIGELNAVRKHLSAVKGGRLARAAHPAQVVTLLLSDVIGDRLDVIASGPTAPDASSFADAWAVIAKYGLQEKLPLRVKEYLRRGLSGHEVETAKSGDPCFVTTRNIVIGGIRQALAAAEEKAQQLGLAVETLSAELHGEARAAAHWLAQSARARLAGLPENEPLCLLSGGETTVTVKGAGKGGRNQELALAFALEADGMTGVSMLSAGTDGTDGPTDAAGALVTWETVAQARRLGIDPAQYLENNDSYTFFRRFDQLSGAHSHLKTGPTGTNVMDIQIVLCAKGINWQ